jgi:hypothetical protein
MTTELRTIPAVPARLRRSWWLPSDHAGSAFRRVSWPIFRTRRELDGLRGEVRQLEYIQQSLLRTMDRLLDATDISLETETNDGNAVER